jgi:hypothetical protein
MQGVGENDLLDFTPALKARARGDQALWLCDALHADE